MLTEQNAVSMGLLVYLYQKPEMGGNLRDCLQNSVKFCRGRAGLGLVGRVVPMEGMAKRRDRASLIQVVFYYGYILKSLQEL